MARDGKPRLWPHDSVLLMSDQRQNECPTCCGTGVSPNDKNSDCAHCAGAGAVSDTFIEALTESWELAYADGMRFVNLIRKPNKRVKL